jgi:hypothetical protein
MCQERGLRVARERAGEVILAELRDSRTRFPDRFHSLPEAVSVLEEELDELKDAVRANKDVFTGRIRRFWRAIDTLTAGGLEHRQREIS